MFKWLVKCAEILANGDRAYIQKLFMLKEHHIIMQY